MLTAGQAYRREATPAEITPHERAPRRVCRRQKLAACSLHASLPSLPSSVSVFFPRHGAPSVLQLLAERIFSSQENMAGAKAATTAERSGYVNRGPSRPQGGDSRGDHAPQKEHPGGCAVGRNLPLVPSTHLCRNRPSRLPFRPFFLATAHLQFYRCSRKGFLS